MFEILIIITAALGGLGLVLTALEQDEDKAKSKYIKSLFLFIISSIIQLIYFAFVSYNLILIITSIIVLVIYNILLFIVGAFRLK